MEPSGQTRVHAGTASATLEELSRRFERDRGALPGAWGGPVAFACDTAEEGVGAAAFLARTGIDALILPTERLSPDVAALLAQEGFAIQRRVGELERPSSPAAAVPGRVRLLTSGTTGLPKLVPHRWETLFTLEDADRLAPARWLLTYQTGTYAWFQMVTLALFAPAQELVVGDRLDPAFLLEAAVAHHADAVSSTPTFWRCAFLQADAGIVRRLAWRQITLGGERVDQVLLDQLRGLYPGARLTHIYASTEVGAAIAVHDGREGFPAAWLEGGPGHDGERRPALRIEDDTLRVRSPHAATDRPGWVDTGDRVERHGDRVLIVGRRDSSLLNIGGMKIAAHAVERALLEHPRVAWCRARARRSEIVGSLVEADVVLRDPAVPGLDAETELAAHARARLPEYAVPRLWRILDAIPVSDSGKTEVS